MQRSTLDVLLLCFPLHSPHLTTQDHLQHMLASLKVLLRRDMSLNRRLYAWLLGTDSNGVSLLPGKWIVVAGTGDSTICVRCRSLSRSSARSSAGI